MNAFRGSLGIRVIQCRPADPEATGLVERANGYLETSFLPGRRFASPADFNVQLEQWLVLANHRMHRRLQARPADRVDSDRSAMVALPPVTPPRNARATLPARSPTARASLSRSQSGDGAARSDGLDGLFTALEQLPTMRRLPGGESNAGRRSTRSGKDRQIPVVVVDQPTSATTL